MKILFASSEVAPFAKTGGLADVVGSLPKSLKVLKHDVRVIMPRYSKIEVNKYKLKEVISPLKVNVGEKTVSGSLMESTFPKTKTIVYFVDQPEYFQRPELYGEDGVDYSDNADRFSFFCQAVLNSVKALDWHPDIIHCHDWQTSLIPLYLKKQYKEDPFYNNIGTVLTIHNLAYQGLFPPEKLPVMMLPWDLFTPDQLEFYGKVNTLKAGILFADKINTVSETYASEIQTPEYGCGLEGVITQRREDLTGIINGIDYKIWNPKTDTQLEANYSKADASAKARNKLHLQKLNGLEQDGNIPVIGMISRLVDQKGFDILAEKIDKIMEMGVQLVLLGTGDPHYHKIFEEIEAAYPEQAGINLKYDGMLAQKIYSGADMFLMPSRFEPCGLGQLISLAYGSVPIVRATGGLADTVVQWDPLTQIGNGFVFKEYSSKKLLETIELAVAAFRERSSWKKLVQNGMTADFSWKASAKKYVSLYKSALDKK